VTEILRILHYHNKGPHLNTLDKFHIHREAQNQIHLNDEHTIFPNPIFEVIARPIHPSPLQTVSQLRPLLPTPAFPHASPIKPTRHKPTQIPYSPDNHTQQIPFTVELLALHHTVLENAQWHLTPISTWCYLDTATRTNTTSRTHRRTYPAPHTSTRPYGNPGL
jgi:hypothetical protein